MNELVEKIEIDGNLPISVIIPLSESRKHFFYSFVLPMIKINSPKEIIILSNDASAPVKRNLGFDLSSQPYLFFCDDDIILPCDYFSKLYSTLLRNPQCGYSYTGYVGIVIDTKNHPIHNNFNMFTKEFNGETLKIRNYISTMSLIKRDAFIKFDESLVRFQDWDLYLTLLENDIFGVACFETYFFAYYLDTGITNNNDNTVTHAYEQILIKHNL